jgi:Fe-S cluster assembly protein SufD
MGAEARYPGLLSREVAVLSTFTPESAGALPGLPWLQRRRAASAEAFATSPLPSEKDEVWRYSRIDQLDLDRFRPVGTAESSSSNGPGPSPSDRIHALVSSLGPRSGLMVTINGVLATVASSVGDDALALGRLAEHGAGEQLFGSVVGDPRDFLLLNDAFAIDPLVIDVAAGVTVEDPVVVVHVLSGAGGHAVFPRTVIRGGERSHAGIIEIVVDVDTGLLADLPSPSAPMAGGSVTPA